MTLSHSSESTRLVPTRLGRLHVRLLGADDGHPTVLWSSMFVDGTTWDALLPLLLATQPARRIVIVDPPGLGRSEPLARRSSIAEAADAAVDLLGELRMSSGVDWVGNAFGGHVGFDLATRDGVLRTLVAISSPAEAIPPSLRRQIRMLAPVLAVFGPVGPVRSAVISAMLTEASAADPEIVATVRASLERPVRRSLGLALRSFILDRTDVSAALPRIRVPALFVASDDRGDWSPVDAERSAAATPGARAITIAGARTLIPLEQPAALATALDTFWAASPPDGLERAEQVR